MVLLCIFPKLFQYAVWNSRRNHARSREKGTAAWLDLDALLMLHSQSMNLEWETDCNERDASPKAWISELSDLCKKGVPPMPLSERGDQKFG